MTTATCPPSSAPSAPSAPPIAIGKHVGLVHSVARRYRFACRGALEYDDLVQAGLMGLARAAEKFDASLGFAFSTYATVSIRYSIQRTMQYAGRTIRLPVHVHDQRIRAGEPLPPHCVSTDAPRGEGDDRQLDDIFAAEEPDAETVSVSAERARAVEAAVAGLPPKMRRVVQLRFYENETLTAVGERLGFSKQRAQQLEARALALLRKRLAAAGGPD